MHAERNQDTRPFQWAKKTSNIVLVGKRRLHLVYVTRYLITIKDMRKKMMNEAEIYERQGFGKSSGFGKTPALLVVDFVNGFNDPDILGGGNIPAAIQRTADLIGCARRHSIPICFTRVVYAANRSDQGVFCMKNPSLTALDDGAHASQIVDDLTPLENDYILCKTQPSAFFGTNLVGWLVGKNVDTVLVTGCTTSGCVRATVVDAMSYNFRTIVVSDCVGDRAAGPHAANLFDMQQKYADLLTCAEIENHLGD